ncbi:TauD/TfdA family dioxygenase [Sphingosinicella sp. CPCC 101087]|uniref:TauD/TfdA family dioxygenase n=1 Tax=Sphingosinicella sp. CPCC 101087 TaxID=2497754 RepID=UPI00101BBC9C|nr:TauD/TfdA family dioxygenase [Sphingosinicella sp. CPCC 101087]
MNTLHDGWIDHPSAWRSEEIGGREGLTKRLGREHVEALEELLGRFANVPPTAISRADFAHPLIDDLMAHVRHELMHGRGALILSGLDLRRFTLDEFEKIYWGLGTHLGNAVAQSYRRDRIGHVQKEEDNPTGRGYLMDVELRSHTDFHELLSLASVRKAEEGGLSGVVSSLALHNHLYENAYELLRPLYEGFYHESANGEVSKSKVPIFGCVQGKVSCYYHLPFIFNAAKIMGVDLPEDLVKATRALNEAAALPSIRADFMLEPGEMLFWHNFTALHSRTAFKDSLTHKRLLLRLWLNVPDGRPLPPQFHERARYMDRAHEGGEAAINYVKEDS